MSDITKSFEYMLDWFAEATVNYSNHSVNNNHTYHYMQIYNERKQALLDCHNQLRDELTSRDKKIAELLKVYGECKDAIARRDEELKITDGLLKEATETIGAVVACCTYNSNDDLVAIEKFICRYNRVPDEVWVWRGTMYIPVREGEK